ncbi:hypothetical protein A6A11_00275 [Bisgaardia hudsonensis]|nr:hypothetical protein [Bisgaardia hudsonensis]QLB12157.1 hypothetical protein A6A11_00275 [Bisgaardia hudsonensis]
MIDTRMSLAKIVKNLLFVTFFCSILSSCTSDKDRLPPYNIKYLKCIFEAHTSKSNGFGGTAVIDPAPWEIKYNRCKHEKF